MCNNVTKAVEAIRKLESSDQINQIIDAIKLQPVSYTHLTLPTIYSV